MFYYVVLLGITASAVLGIRNIPENSLYGVTDQANYFMDLFNSIAASLSAFAYTKEHNVYLPSTLGVLRSIHRLMVEAPTAFHLRDKNIWLPSLIIALFIISLIGAINCLKENKFGKIAITGIFSLTPIMIFSYIRLNTWISLVSLLLAIIPICHTCLPTPTRRTLPEIDQLRDSTVQKIAQADNLITFILYICCQIKLIFWMPLLFFVFTSNQSKHRKATLILILIVVTIFIQHLCAATFDFQGWSFFTLLKNMNFWNNYASSHVLVQIDLGGASASIKDTYNSWLLINREDGIKQIADDMMLRRLTGFISICLASVIGSKVLALYKSITINKEYIEPLTRFQISICSLFPLQLFSAKSGFYALGILIPVVIISHYNLGSYTLSSRLKCIYTMLLIYCVTGSIGLNSDVVYKAAFKLIVRFLNIATLTSLLCFILPSHQRKLLL